MPGQRIRQRRPFPGPDVHRADDAASLARDRAPEADADATERLGRDEPLGEDVVAGVEREPQARLGSFACGGPPPSRAENAAARRVDDPRDELGSAEVEAEKVASFLGRRRIRSRRRRHGEEP